MLRQSATALAVSALLLALPAMAADEIQTLSMEELSDEEVQFVSVTGTEIIGEIKSARAALDRRELLVARAHVAKARAKLGKVRNVSPAARIQDRIARALESLTTSGTQTSDQQLQPIYAELDAVEDDQAFVETRASVDKAKAHIAAGRRDEAVAALIEASATVSYLEIDLPVEATYSRLTHALIALSRKDPMGAAAWLKEAQDHTETFVRIASVSVEEADVAAGPE